MSEALILVAEDEPDIRELIAFSLRFKGFRVAQAVNGVEAVQLASELLPNLILLDIRMPKMNGHEACRILKSQTATQAIPIVFLSAKDKPEDITTGLELGAAAYLVKPFDPDELPLQIREILSAL